MKEYAGFALLFVVLSGFGLWQMGRANDAVADSVKKQAKLEVQEATIKRLEDLGKKIDDALEVLRGEREQIQTDRQQTRQDTKEAARKDPSLQEQLATPLHPALRGGGGLLGRDNRGVSERTALPAPANPGP